MNKFLVLILCAVISLLPVSCGESPVSGGEDALLSPEIVTVTSHSDSRLTISWVLNSDGEEAVTLERRGQNSADPFTVVGELQAGITEFTDSLLNPNLSYEYRVRVSAGNETAVSDPATVRNDRVITGIDPFRTINYSAAILGVAFSRGGDSLAFGSANREAEIWNIASSPAVSVENFRGHNGQVTSVDFSSDGSRLLTGSLDNTAVLWSTSTGNLIRQYTGHAFSVRSVMFAANGEELLTAASDGTAKLWDLQVGGNPITTFISPGGGYFEAVINPGGTRVAAAGNSFATIDLYDYDRETQTGTLADISPLSGHAAPVLCVDYGPDDNLLASGGEDNQVRIWDLSSGTSQLLDTLNDDIYSVAISPDGKYVASASVGAVTIWNLETGSLVDSFTGHAGLVRTVAFSHDGTLLASGGQDGTVRVYELEYDYNGWEIVE